METVTKKIKFTRATVTAKSFCRAIEFKDLLTREIIQLRENRRHLFPVMAHPAQRIQNQSTMHAA